MTEPEPVNSYALTEAGQFAKRWGLYGYPQPRSDLYVAHMASDYWAAARSTMLHIAGYQCERSMPGQFACQGPLEVHHVHYRTLGRERPGDLEVLCEPCHHAADHRRRSNNALRAWAEITYGQRWRHRPQAIPPRMLLEYVQAVHAGGSPALRLPAFDLLALGWPPTPDASVWYAASHMSGPGPCSKFYRLYRDALDLVPDLPEPGLSDDDRYAPWRYRLTWEWLPEDGIPNPTTLPKEAR